MAGIQCTTSAVTNGPHLMLKIYQCFDRYCICHLQGEYIMVGCFWQPYIGQAVESQIWC
jgi:hypothetical protein